MEEILTPKQMQEADQYMISHYQLPSLLLMEQAAQGIFYWIKANFTFHDTFLIVYGKGNNGGDGLALARLLSENGYKVAILPANEEKESTFIINQQLSFLKDLPIIYLTYEQKSSFQPTLLIDAIFGIGLSRNLSESYRSIIAWMNQQNIPIISIDIPSGIYEGACSSKDFIKARYTLSIGFFKTIQFFDYFTPSIGELILIPMGINGLRKPNFKSNPIFRLNNDEIHKFPVRNVIDHKASVGRALLVGGSQSMAGSIIMSALGCAKIGCGILEVLTEKNTQISLNTHLPEVIVHDFDFRLPLDSRPFNDSNFQSLCIGPGLGRNHSKLFKSVLEYAKQKKIPLVIDADGLYILSQNQEFISELDEQTILTPHLKEMSRLINKSIDQLKQDPLNSVSSFMEKFKGTLVLKSSNTMIFTSKATYIYEGKCPILATAGSGDVLSGIITGLLSNGLTSLNAALLGVFLHGEGGKMLHKRLGNQPILARQIMDGVQQVLQEKSKNDSQ